MLLQHLIMAALGNATASPTPIIDTLGVAAAHAYGLRLLRNAYIGNPAIRVRRSSDSAEQDIGFAGTGALDTATMLTFCGAGNGFVKTWYDQSGNTRDYTQTTTANQPQIVSAGSLIHFSGSLPGIQFDGSNDILRGGAVTIAQPFTRSTVLKFLSVASGQNITSDGANCSLNFSALGSLAMYAGTNVNIKTGISANDLATVIEVFNGASSQGRYNAATATVNPGTNSTLRQNVGGAYNGTTDSSWANVVAAEYIVFASALSSGNRSTLEANQKAYWGTP